ncbi:hypothetical protein [Flavobacterium sp. 3HN19-14]|uniref:hypothetical protein n=1 Tax=Flavobacterium sp. 3HN19-14 TaxID=3448133 RepID=UPI003EDEA318
MKTTQEKLIEIKSHGYEFNFGQVFEQTFENYKKIALLGGVVMLVFVIILLIISTGLSAILGMATFMSGDLTGWRTTVDTGSLTAFSLISKVGVAILTAGFVAPVTAGVLQMAHNAETYKEFSFATAFEHYKSGHFKNLFIASLVISLFSQAFQVAFDMVRLYSDFPMDYIIPFALLNAVLGAVIWLLMLFSIPLIIFGKLSASEAIKGSMMLVIKRFWVILFLSIIVFICACLGIIGLCIGVFFTMPIIYSFQYIAYRTAVDIDEVDEMDEIGFSEDSRFE